MTEPLTMWTVYDHPRDFPDMYVARKWVIEEGEPRATGDVRGTPFLWSLRRWLEHQGLYCMPRDDRDDSKIIETWL